MKLTNKINKFLFDSKARFRYFVSKGFYDSMPDDKFLKKEFKIELGYELNLEYPRTFCEKIQWLKLYDRNPEYTKMADKHEVKSYVANRIGKRYVIPEYGVWSHFDEIDFDRLPDQFVLKCNHNSGGYVVCKDKRQFDRVSARKRLEKCLSRNYYKNGREWVYKDIKPCILAEKYIDSLGKPDSVEYKLSCFGGKVGFVTVCQGIAHSDYSVRKNDHFDINFNHMPWYAYYENAVVRPSKPEQWDEMIEVAEKLAKGIPYVRVDLYVINGKVFFGEMTFYTWSGFIEFTPKEWDEKLGEMIRLPK